MPLRGPLRQMREQNYAGGITGRRDLMHLEFRAFTRRKREQIIKKWSKCTGRWAAGAARGMPCVVHVSHDWYRHQCTPERLLMKQLPRICLLPDSMVFFSNSPLQVWWESADAMMTTLKTFLRNSPCASDKVSGFQEGKFCLFLNASPPLITLALLLCRSLCEGNVKTCLEMENQCMTQSNSSKKNYSYN